MIDLSKHINLESLTQSLTGESSAIQGASAMATLTSAYVDISQVVALWPNASFIAVDTYHVKAMTVDGRSVTASLPTGCAISAEHLVQILNDSSDYAAARMTMGWDGEDLWQYLYSYDQEVAGCCAAWSNASWAYAVSNSIASGAYPDFTSAINAMLGDGPDWIYNNAEKVLGPTEGQTYVKFVEFVTGAAVDLATGVVDFINAPTDYTDFSVVSVPENFPVTWGQYYTELGQQIAGQIPGWMAAILGFMRESVRVVIDLIGKGLTWVSNATWDAITPDALTCERYGPNQQAVLDKPFSHGWISDDLWATWHYRIRSEFSPLARFHLRELQPNDSFVVGGTLIKVVERGYIPGLSSVYGTHIALYLAPNKLATVADDAKSWQWVNFGLYKPEFDEYGTGEYWAMVNSFSDMVARLTSSPKSGEVTTLGTLRYTFCRANTGLFLLGLSGMALLNRQWVSILDSDNQLSLSVGSEVYSDLMKIGGFWINGDRYVSSPIATGLNAKSHINYSIQQVQDTLFESGYPSSVKSFTSQDLALIAYGNLCDTSDATFILQDTTDLSNSAWVGGMALSIYWQYLQPDAIDQLPSVRYWRKYGLCCQFHPAGAWLNSLPVLRLTSAAEYADYFGTFTVGLLLAAAAVVGIVAARKYGVVSGFSIGGMRIKGVVKIPLGASDNDLGEISQKLTIIGEDITKTQKLITG